MHQEQFEINSMPNLLNNHIWLYLKILEKLSRLLTHVRLVSFLLDIGKQNSPSCDAAKR